MSRHIETSPRATKLAQEMANGLGFTISWSFNGTAIRPDDLRNRLTMAGLDPSGVKDIAPLDGIKIAVREFSVRDGKKVTGRATITKVSGDRVVIGLRYLEARAGDDEAMDANQKEKLVYDLINDCWEEPGNSEAAQKLRTRVQHRQTYYDGNAVREKLVAPMLNKSHGIVWHNGVWFVPVAGADTIGELQDALQGMDTFRLDCGGIVRGVGQEGKVLRSATDTLGSQLETLSGQIEGWVDMSRRVRSDTIDHVMGRFDELFDNAQMYEAALSVSLGDLQERIDTMRTRAREVIDVKEKAANGVAAGPTRKESLAQMATAQLAETYTALSGEEAPDDREDLIDQLDDLLAGLEADADAEDEGEQNAA